VEVPLTFPSGGVAGAKVELAVDMMVKRCEGVEMCGFCEYCWHDRLRRKVGCCGREGPIRGPVKCAGLHYVELPGYNVIPTSGLWPQRNERRKYFRRVKRFEGMEWRRVPFYHEQDIYDFSVVMLVYAAGFRQSAKQRLSHPLYFRT
jgi:hypothetical protein